MRRHWPSSGYLSQAERAGERSEWPGSYASDSPPMGKPPKPQRPGAEPYHSTVPLINRATSLKLANKLRMRSDDGQISDPTFLISKFNQDSIKLNKTPKF